jgi:hypothetical protein
MKRSQHEEAWGGVSYRARRFNPDSKEGSRPLLTIRDSLKRWFIQERLTYVPVLCSMVGVWGCEKGTEPLLSCDS